MTEKLTTTDHSRASAGLTYVYPVLSRRSGGLSVGINLNPNNACNWSCVYCQVPGLVRGNAPAIDLELLEQELRGFLRDVIEGDFYWRFDVPAEQRVIRDIALSGNGEPTSAEALVEVIGLTGRCMAAAGLGDGPPLVLITNGSLVQQSRVREGLASLATLNGRVWFKLDRATDAGLREINRAAIGLQRQRENLITACGLCPTWVQSCWFMRDGAPPGEAEQEAFAGLLQGLVEEAVPLRGVLLYGLARPSMQPGASRLAALPPEWLDALAGRVRETGLQVEVSY